MKFYKYMKLKWLHEVLRPEGIRLLINTPSEFNDPFDSTGQVFGTPTPTFIDNYLQGRQSLRDKAQAENQSLANMVTKDFAGLMQSRKAFDAFLRFFCMASATSDNNVSTSLMWSHYADNAKGVRLTLDLEGTHISPTPVRYCFVAPSLDLSSPQYFGGEEPSIEKFCLECAFTKDLAWSYENEWRIIFPVDDLDKLERFGVSVTKEGERYFWHPARHVVKRIDFGVQASNADVDSAVKRLTDDGYDDVQIFVAKKNRAWEYEYQRYAVNSLSQNQ